MVAEIPCDTQQAPRWLDPQQQRDWRAAITGMTFLMRALSHDLEVDTGLSMHEYEILVRLSESPDRGVRMADLADQVAHSRSRVTHTIARLERGGLVVRIPDCVDRRGVVAHLTPRGLGRLSEAAPHHVESVRARIIDVLSPRQLQEVGEAMRAVLDAAGLAVPDPVPAAPSPAG